MKRILLPALGLLFVALMVSITILVVNSRRSSSARSPASIPFFGMNSISMPLLDPSDFGGHNPWANPAAYTQIHDLGAPYLRMQFGQAILDGNYSSSDKIMTRLARAGDSALGMYLATPDGIDLNPGGIWKDGCASGSQPPTPGAQTDAYLAAVAQTVRRYGNNGTFWTTNRYRQAHPGGSAYHPIQNWEVWNEPNSEIFWGERCGPGVDPTSYALFYKQVRSTVLSADPDAAVITAGLASAYGPDNDGDGFPDAHPKSMLTNRFLQDELTWLHDHGVQVDGVGLHPYADSPQRVIADVAAARDVVAASGYNSGLWLTEWGWATAGHTGPQDGGSFVSNQSDVGNQRLLSEQDQAKAIAETLTLFSEHRRNLGIVTAAYFDLTDQAAYSLGAYELHNATKNWTVGWDRFAGLLRVLPDPKLPFCDPQFSEDPSYPNPPIGGGSWASCRNSAGQMVWTLTYAPKPSYSTFAATTNKLHEPDSFTGGSAQPIAPGP